MLTLGEAIRRVAAGAELLSKHKPNWAWKIKKEKLTLLDPKLCVLGQLYKDYNVGLRELGLLDGMKSTRAKLHGFDWEGLGTKPELLLRAVWLNVIDQARVDSLEAEEEK